MSNLPLRSSIYQANEKIKEKINKDKYKIENRLQSLKIYFKEMKDGFKPIQNLYFMAHNSERVRASFIESKLSVCMIAPHENDHNNNRPSRMRSYHGTGINHSQFRNLSSGAVGVQRNNNNNVSTGINMGKFHSLR